MSDQEIRDALEAAQNMEPPRLKSISHRELMSTQYEPLKWIIPDLLPEGLTILAGSSKIGKSWLALDLCQSVAFGDYGINHKPVNAGSVLYLALEDSERRLQERFRMISTGNMRQSERLHFCTEIPRAHEGGLALISGWLDEHPDCRLIVIDTLQRFRETSGRGVETYGSDYEAMIPLQKLARDRRIALVLVHHTRKADAKDPFDKVSGTTAIMGAADSVWLLSRARGEADGTLNITGRDVNEQDLAMRFDKNNCTWAVIGNVSEVASSDEEREILDFLWDSDQPVTPTIVAKALGISCDAVKKRLRRMHTKEKVTQSGY